jgi:hypothetical protein
MSRCGCEMRRSTNDGGEGGDSDTGQEWLERSEANGLLSWVVEKWKCERARGRAHAWSRENDGSRNEKGRLGKKQPLTASRKTAPGGRLKIIDFDGQPREFAMFGKGKTRAEEREREFVVAGRVRGQVRWTEHRENGAGSRKKVSVAGEA